MPSSNIGWSSTARIRIKLGPVLMIVFRSLPEKPETGAGGECLVSDGPRNAQIYLRAGSEFTPDVQLRSDVLGSLAHSRQAPVPRTSAAFKDAGVNARSIVAEAQTKQRFAISDFCFYMPGLCVVKGISQRFPRNAVYLVLQDRTHGSRCALYKHTKRNRLPVAGSKLFAQVSHQRSHRFRQIPIHQTGGAHVRYNISAFADCLIRPIEGTFKGLFRLHGARRKHLVNGLKAEHQSLKAL